MYLLAISLENLDFREIRDTKVECGLILDAEHIFQDTFSEETAFLKKRSTCYLIGKDSSVVLNLEIEWYYLLFHWKISNSVKCATQILK